MPNHTNVPFAATEILVQVIDTLLQAILTSGTVHPVDHSSVVAVAAEHTLSPSAVLAWDRIDALSNALITFVALDTARFSQSAQYLVGMQAPSLQPTLLHCLTQLTSARGVNLQAIDKPNRQKFLLNFREFVAQIKSLSLK